MPLYKANRSSFNCTDFRPIQLSSVIGKLVERIVLLRIHYAIGSQWCSNQFAATPGVSSEEALAVILSTIRTAMRPPVDGNNKQDLVSPLAIFYDFSDAFTRVNCADAAASAAELGAPNYIVSLIRHFGDHQRFKVRIGGHVSREFAVEGGVPQGSVLGPLIFAHHSASKSRFVCLARRFLDKDGR